MTGSYLSATLGCIVLLVLAPAAQAASYPVQEPEDIPRFSRHVAAVLSKLGCNGGTCHGAVKGQNGFRLTLFGADPGLDHSRLIHEFGGRRLNFQTPENSLLLLKATGQVSHEGGKRMAVGDADYETFRRWIAAGAKLDALEPSRITRLKITPAEHTARPGESYRLRVEATFADGSREEVTRLCSFESLDKQVAICDRDGQVLVKGVGDTALMVRYIADPAIALVL